MRGGSFLLQGPCLAPGGTFCNVKCGDKGKVSAASAALNSSGAQKNNNLYDHVLIFDQPATQRLTGSPEEGHDCS
jgi:hypothetical protein